MKHFTRIVALIALVALFFTCALAEGPTFEDLLAQRQDIDRQLIAVDDFGPFPIAQGTFEAGVDLPAGTYRVETAVMTAISVYEGEFTEDAEPTAAYTVAQDAPVEELLLSEGNVFVISGTQTTFTLLALEGEPAEEHAEAFRELLESLRDALDEEMIASEDYHYLKTSHGTYTIGVDLPAGTYCTNNPAMCVVAIYNGDPHVEENLVKMYTVTKREPIEKFELEEGMTLMIDGMTDIEISTYIGLKM